MVNPSNSLLRLNEVTTSVPRMLPPNESTCNESCERWITAATDS
jgi:hypothetical protein